MPGPTTKEPRRRRGTTKSARTAMRVQWAIETWSARLSMPSEELKRLMMDRFGIGEHVARDTMAALTNVLNERASDPTVASRIHDAMLDDIEALKRKGEHAQANQAAYRFAKVFGIAAPEKLEISFGDRDEEHDELTDEEVEALAKLDGGDDEGAAVH